MTTATADLGLIGLAVMGQNLVLNMNDNDFVISVFNRTVSKVDDFMAGEAAGTNIVPTHSIEELVATLKRPRRVMLLVKAGAPVDAFIDMVIPLLEAGDIIIDGGNSNFHDTIRRCEYVESKGLLFVGTGVSGGEEGARRGPSIMPGGSEAAWPAVKKIFQAVSAKADNGEACCDWVGRGGAGHFVKMVHNGIEYGDMQLICEAYQLMTAAGISPAEQSEIFGTWNEGVLDSYLIEITRDILAKVDDETGQPMVDVILDTAGQKGTGKWTGITALDLGMPLTLIGEAVFARCLSAMKDQRVAAAGPLAVDLPAIDAADKAAFIEDIRQALYASKIVSYAQGYQLMQEASRENDWGLNYGGIALMWRGGCIIRSAFLDKIAAFEACPTLENLLLDDYFRGEMAACQSGWRTTIAKAIAAGIPTPAFASALAYFDGYRCERLPANLLQAQRDYFGCHTYERTDKPRGEFFHTKWIEGAGDTTASTYDV